MTEHPSGGHFSHLAVNKKSFEHTNIDARHTSVTHQNEVRADRRMFDVPGSSLTLVLAGLPTSFWPVSRPSKLLAGLPTEQATRNQRFNHELAFSMPLIEQLSLADSLLAIDREAMMRPSELPGRYGRVIRDLERLVAATDIHAVVAGGWAVWRYGYVGRVTQDVDVVIPESTQASVLEFAPMFGFDVLPVREGMWPKLTHRETAVDVDLMPEAGIPGTATRPAPVPIRHPSVYGAKAGELSFIEFAGLFELKLGAHRAKDIADLVELIKVNTALIDEIRKQLEQIHPSYSAELSTLIQQAHEESG